MNGVSDRSESEPTQQRTPTHVVRDGDIVAPFRHAQDLFLDPPRLLAQHLFRRIRQDTQDEFVVLFLLLGQVLIRAARVVVIRLRTSRAGGHADTLRRALEDCRHLSVEADIDATRFELVLPVGVEFGLVREDLRRKGRVSPAVA
jgi:hypothetical protein